MSNFRLDPWASKMADVMSEALNWMPRRLGVNDYGFGGMASEDGLLLTFNEAACAVLAFMDDNWTVSGFYPDMVDECFKIGIGEIKFDELRGISFEISEDDSYIIFRWFDESEG